MFQGSRHSEVNGNLTYLGHPQTPMCQYPPMESERGGRSSSVSNMLGRCCLIQRVWLINCNFYCQFSWVSASCFHFVPNYFIPNGLKAQTTSNLYQNLTMRAHIRVQFWLPRLHGASEIEEDTLILTLCHILCNYRPNSDI